MKKQPNYLIISELFLPTKGGTAVWFSEVYSRLGKSENHVVTASVHGDSIYDRQHRNTIHRISLKRHWWLRPSSLAIYIKLYFASLYVALRFRVTYIHAGRVLPEGLVALKIARLLRRPVVIYAHGEEITGWRAPRRIRAMKRVYRRANRVIANSEFTRDELLKLGVSRDKISLISPGVNLERFRPIQDVGALRATADIKSDQLVILTVGRLSRRKGFDQVIRVIPQLRSAGLDVHYVIVGIGEDWDYLHSLATEQGVADYVHMLGHVSSDDLPRWYNTADVVVMPNREVNGDTEGFGMVFLEAAACRTPAIAGKAGGTGSAIVDGETGLRVDGESVEEIYAALHRILGDSEYAEKLGEAGYQRAISEFSWDSVADKTRQMSQSL